MNRIKSIQQLKFEKKQLKRRAAELENNIMSNWKELRKALKPGTISKDILIEETRSGIDQSSHGGNLLKNTLRYGLTLMAKKITDKAAEKIGGIFKKPTLN